MKKSLILGLLGLAASVAASFGQGTINLDNYNFGTATVTYGQGNIPANGVSGAAGGVGSGLQAGWTMGLYYVVGAPAIGADPNPNPVGDPSTFTGGLALGTGTGSTAAFASSTFGTPGKALASFGFAVPGTSAAGGDTVTLEVVAYNGASYAASGFRGHSAPFTLVTSVNTAQSPTAVGTAMSSFGVFIVPEPSVFALAGLGGDHLVTKLKTQSERPMPKQSPHTSELAKLPSKHTK